VPAGNDQRAAAPVPGLLAALLRSDQPFAPPTGAAPAGTALCVPVHLGEELRGLLLLGTRRSQDPYRRRERDALVLLAHQVAAALQLVDRMAELRTRNAELAQLTSRLARAREEERKHLSHELHDAVAQDLVAITRQLRRHQQTTLPEAIWQDMTAQAQEALTAIRRICNDLRPAILDMGLTSALRELVDRPPQAPYPVRVHLEVEGAEGRLDEEREFALYRVTQEALANVIKHAEATEVTIVVHFGPASTAVEIRDNGRGFAVPARLEEIGGDHLGLLGMRERLTGLGGTVCVESASGEGTCVRAEIPS
jgi:two-component system NarL family sensor kinase